MGFLYGPESKFFMKNTFLFPPPQDPAQVSQCLGRVLCTLVSTILHPYHTQCQLSMECQVPCLCQLQPTASEAADRHEKHSPQSGQSK